MYSLGKDDLELLVLLSPLTVLGLQVYTVYTGACLVYTVLEIRSGTSRTLRKPSTNCNLSQPQR